MRLKNRNSDIKISVLLVCSLLICSLKAYPQKAIDLKYLPAIIKLASDGDTIRIKDGVYHNIRITITGKFSSNVVIMPENVGKVTITGNSTFLISKSENILMQGMLFALTKLKNTLIITESKSIKIFNNYFYQCGSDPNDITIRIDGGSSNNYINSNTIDDSRSMGIVIIANEKDLKNKNNVDNKITNNLFYNTPSVRSIHPNSIDNGFETIVLGQGHKGTEKWSLNTEVSNNLFEQIIGDRSEIISNKTSGNSINNNTFMNNDSGITIRLGSNVKVTGNYLLNTTRGIRVFGFGHEITKNYIVNGRVGIELPSADLRNFEQMTGAAYFQSENVLIKNNIIINPSQVPILMGNGKRDYLPFKIAITDNEIITKGEFISMVGNVKNQSIRVEHNSIVHSESLKSSNINKIRNLLNRPVELITGFLPFTSRDIRVGADWKRPKVVNYKF